MLSGLQKFRRAISNFSQNSKNSVGTAVDADCLYINTSTEHLILPTYVVCTGKPDMVYLHPKIKIFHQV